MTTTHIDEPVELGSFYKMHRIWKTIAALSIAVAVGVIGVGIAWDQLTSTLLSVVGFCALFAASMWTLTWFVQRSLRIEGRGLVSSSAMRESVLSWPEIAHARVGRSEVGEHHPKLIIEGTDGRPLVAYGRGLINRPLEEAAELINAQLRR